jgi:hypothetical protein
MPGQPGQQPGQQGQPMTAQEAQLKAQQQQNAALMMQQRMNRQGATILCLHAYAEHLSGFQVRRRP